MGTRNFQQMLEQRWEQGRFVCVGLDSYPAQIPEAARHKELGETILHFNRAIVDATADLVCAYKPNSAFYEAYGVESMTALYETIKYIQKVASDVPVILDAKRGDIGNTNEGYVSMAFVTAQADAITVHPYLGQEAVQPFLDQKDKGVLVLCRTSNKGAGEFQDGEMYGRPLYEYVAFRVATRWNANGNCGLVVGATYPDELKKVREVVGDLPILIPGIGAQGGDVEQTVKAGKDSRGRGMIINSSRGIIFASKGNDFAEVARRKTQELHDLINQYR